MRRDVTTNDPFRRGAVWRGVVGCALAYVLVITALLSALLQAESMTQAAAGVAAPHCLSDGSGPAPADPGQSDDGSHCPLCTLACGPAVLPTALGMAWSTAPVAGAPLAGREFPPIPRRSHSAPLPRGPPSAV